MQDKAGFNPNAEDRAVHRPIVVFECSFGSKQWYTAKDHAPVLEMMETDYGFIYHSSGMQYLANVLMDDEHTLFVRTDTKEFAKFDGEHLPNTNHWYGRFRPKSNRENGYLLDREAQRTGKSYTGVGGGISSEDQTVVESIGPVVDRRSEHFISPDMMIVRFRNRTIECAFALADGVPAPAVDNPDLYSYLAAGHMLVPDNLTFTEVADRLDEMQGQLKQEWDVGSVPALQA